MAGLPGIFTKDSFAGFYGAEGKDQIVAGGRYRPLSLATFALEVEAFGMQPMSGHVINALLYGLLAAVVFAVLLVLFPDRRQDFLVAALFVAHPVHTEVVANIKSRDELLALLLSLSTLLMALRGGHQLLTGMLFQAALFAKENSITFLVIIPISLWYFRKADTKAIAVTAGILFVCAAFFLLVRMQATPTFVAGSSDSMLNNPFTTLEDGSYRPLDAAESSALILLTLGKYLQLLVFPYPLTHDYYPMVFPHTGWVNPWVWVSLAAHLALLVLAGLGWGRRSIAGYGLIFYLLTLSIISNVFFTVGTNMAERFLFMPSFGFILLAFYLRPPVIVGLVVIFSVLSFTRNFARKDHETLFRADIAVSSDSAKLNNAMGGALIDRAVEREPYDLAVLAEAQHYLNRAIEIHPRYKQAFLLHGNAALFSGNYDRAIESYRSALAIDPGYEDAAHNLETVLQALRGPE